MYAIVIIYVIIDLMASGCETRGHGRNLASEKDTGEIPDNGDQKINNTTVLWHAWVTTGNKLGAGTDAHVYMDIHGDQGVARHIALTSYDNDFERGQTDKFEFTTAEIGTPFKIRISHDNTGSFPGWFLVQVVLIRQDLRDRFTFYNNRWLALEEDDHKIDRELLVSSIK